MNELVLNRLRSQARSPAPQAKIFISPTIHISPPINSSDLYNLLIKELSEPESVNNIMESLDSIEFGNIYNFVEWYLNNVGKFTPNQNQALITLVDTRQMIENGCGCKRKHRETVAAQYYQSFWQNNSSTDLIEAVLKATGAKKISFGNFLTYPRYT